MLVFVSFDHSIAPISLLASSADRGFGVPMREFHRAPGRIAYAICRCLPFSPPLLLGRLAAPFAPPARPRG